jgi:hypothetical protein
MEIEETDNTNTKKECLWELEGVEVGIIIGMNGDCTIVSEEVSSEECIKTGGDVGIFLMVNGDVLVSENAVEERGKK